VIVRVFVLKAMSVRPIEALEAAGDFSLRNVVSDSIQPARNNIGQEAAQSGLKFNLSGLKVNEPKPPASTCPTMAPTPSFLTPSATTSSQPAKGLMRFVLPTNSIPTPSAMSPPLTALNPATFSTQNANTNTATVQTSQAASTANRRGWSLRSAPASANESSTSQHDVMRLTAYVDDLTRRLKKTQVKLETTELQLARTSHILCSERQTAQAKIVSIKKDLAEAHDVEGKLRSELALRPAKVDTKQSDFMASVENALQNDFQVQDKNKQATQLETRIAALGDVKAALEEEVAALKSAKEIAETESSNLHESNVDGSQRLAAIEFELEEHKARVIEAEKRTETAEAAAKNAEMAAMQLEEHNVRFAEAQIRTQEAEDAAKKAEAVVLEIETEAKAREEAARIAIQVANNAEADAIRRESVRKEFEDAMTNVASQKHVSSTPLTLAMDDGADAPSQIDAPVLIPDLMSLDAPGPRTNAKVKECIDAISAPKEVAKPVTLAPCHNKSSTRSCGTVSGDVLPEHKLSGYGRASGFANQSPTTIVSAIAAYDVPISFGLTNIPAEPLSGAEVVVLKGDDENVPDPTTAMVNAVVSDLKQKFQENVMAKRDDVVRLVAPLV